MGRSLILFFTDKEQFGVVIEEVTFSDQFFGFGTNCFAKKAKETSLEGFPRSP